MPRVPATQSAGRRDNIQLPVKDGEDFKTGAFVVLDGTPEINECGADPVAVYGISEEPAGLNPVDSTKSIIGRATEVARWWMPCGSTPTVANVGVQYGVAMDSDGIWYVDLTDTVHVVVYVHQVDTTTDRVEVSIIEAVRQIAP